MSIVHRLLHAIRALTEEEPKHSRRKRNKNRDSQRNNSKHRQAVALVLTFRDLFTNEGLNILLEDIEANRSSKKAKSNSFNSQSKSLYVSDTSCSKNINLPKLHVSNTVNNATGNLIDLESDIIGETVPVLHEERMSSLLDMTLTRFERVPRIIQPVVPESGSMEVYGRRGKNKKYKHLTVSLSPEDENKTVETLRKALKWSPRKQSVAKFTVPLPKEEEYKAVAVVQNAVNRVKEEQQQKRKRKFKLFKLTFC
ncbi:uncharacterized protein TNIN_220921 [Trichonephila inaurata madagascariensis]|uniref:Uncharacterized protein n=1 Tax=Trichonephila inaurata madagascariensis TaxID=2747483 RepID=A0A8X6IT07_9ARAC|nr:uncharacterized protein TNIN_220921 [Trichonephila inaurata madagascariensis]